MSENFVSLALASLALHSCNKKLSGSVRSSATSSSITVEIVPANSKLQVEETAVLSLDTVTGLGVREAVPAESIVWESSNNDILDPSSAIKANGASAGKKRACACTQ